MIVVAILSVIFLVGVISFVLYLKAKDYVNREPELFDQTTGNVKKATPSG